MDAVLEEGIYQKRNQGCHWLSTLQTAASSATEMLICPGGRPEQREAELQASQDLAMWLLGS